MRHKLIKNLIVLISFLNLCFPLVTIGQIRIPESATKPASPQMLYEHPSIKEMQRRAQTSIPGLKVVYDYSGWYGRQEIADGAQAYIDGKLVGEAKTQQLHTDSTVEVEIKHFSNTGSIIYQGITFFSLINTKTLSEGAPVRSVVILGKETYIVFNFWPVSNHTP